MNCKKLVACFVFALVFPVLAQAQDEDYGEQDHPLNPEYSTTNFQVDYFNYQMDLGNYTSGAYYEQNPYYMQAMMANAMMGGWSFDEIYEAMKYSMFGQNGGAAAFYGCIFGYATVIGGTSIIFGPIGPGMFATGGTMAAIYCAIRHF